MQRSELPSCPTCGNTVEMFFKETRWAGTAQIRCMRCSAHHHIGMRYSPGAKNTTRQKLIEQWEALTQQVQQGKNNG